MKFLAGAAFIQPARLFVWPMLASIPENFNGKVGISPCTLHAEVVQVMNVDCGWCKNCSVSVVSYWGCMRSWNRAKAIKQSELVKFGFCSLSGGYYFIERKEQTLQIIVLNTNLWLNDHHREKAEEQWKWLGEVFKKLKGFKKPVKVSVLNVELFT